MNENKRFLPIGTVVLLKNGTKEIMINSYCVFGKTKADKMYEYGACLYPEGVIDTDNVYVFNHDDIDKVIHLGYSSDLQKEYSKKLNENYDAFKVKFENKQFENMPNL